MNDERFDVDKTGDVLGVRQEQNYSLSLYSSVYETTLQDDEHEQYSPSGRSIYTMHMLPYQYLKTYKTSKR